MATAVLPNDDRLLEIFSLIWLDANPKESRNTEQQLRSIINHLKKFQDIKQCQKYIEQTTPEDRLVLIVSGQMGPEILPSIHKHRQVISIYVYCMNKERNEEWTAKYKKIKAVIVDVDELISRIKTDHKIQKKVEEPLSINFFITSTDTGKSTMEVNGDFVFSQVLIYHLLQLKSTRTDVDELIDCCKRQYEGNQSELDHIDEFAQTYSPDKALWWYTRESFFYKTLNAVLRKSDIHMIFLFRGFIHDIHQQLQKYQSRKTLRVYRSQLISSGELNHLKENIGQFISINSFFSTSNQYDIAWFYLGDRTSPVDVERVLFKIDANRKTVSTKPFADISEYSDFTNEAEVLFMLGSIFRLERIDRNDDDGVWIIQMTLCNDDEHDLEQVLTYMKQQIESEGMNLRTLGKLLQEMGKLDLAEKYFNRLMKELSPNDPIISNLYEDLGRLAAQRGHYNLSVKWRQKVLEFRKQHQSTADLKPEK